MTRTIEKDIKRRLYAESMGRCMNPNCRVSLFKAEGDIIERAHIIPYCDTLDNSFENLIILCPNCHTNFDKNNAFNIEEVKQWKQIRANELDSFFGTKYTSFDELKDKVRPLLMENKTIYENYYLNSNKDLWNKFEPKILVNNRILKKILSNNLNLIQHHRDNHYSNLGLISSFLLHIDEFENSRSDKEKNRHVLFPEKINSLFDISPIDDSFIPSVESLELFISQLNREGKFIDISLGCDNPYISILDSGVRSQIYLKDTPRLRQYYSDYNCFRSASVRLDSLNFALKYINSRNASFVFPNYNNLREIEVQNNKIVFVYEYCLSRVSLEQLCPTHNSIIVNLHNWNGSSCISSEAYDFSREINVTLLDMTGFYKYINEIQ
ncbi:MAG: HNH endonuclease signature motif containing protein [Candidatus Gastranaerophilales bacterium]|nr:HNH endonuclease signature motif containing protein [Candidatus Gastranaerophilales bacterium]